MALQLQLTADGFQFVLNPVALPAHGIGLADMGRNQVARPGEVQGRPASRGMPAAARPVLAWWMWGGSRGKSTMGVV